MSDKKTPKKSNKKQTKEEELQKEVQETQPDKGISLDDLDTAYVVGLTKDGDFVFELLGTNKGLVQLLGVNQHANAKVEQIYNNMQGAGDALVHEVGKGLSVLNQKIDRILNVVDPKKPDNNLG
jgi:hypothetical protein